MSQDKLPKKDYTDGRTKQAFRDETDINQIMKRAQKTGTISHLAKHQATYGDFANYDYMENELMLVKGREIFDDLPSELRDEFRQSPDDFFKYVNDPANSQKLDTLLPGLAAPGRQNIDVSGRGRPEDTPAASPAAQPTTPVTLPGNTPEATEGTTDNPAVTPDST